MDLKIELDLDIWEAISKNYENESYSSAILDTMYLLTETIRNKTGLEGDGISLIGQAFAGENPKIQINNLQTESEKNIQKGMQEVLKGLYTLIRNPRSHDKLNDTKEEADAIIYFISYILKIINKSKLCFEESTFLKRVFDIHFVKTKEYADLLVNEIPKRQRLNIAVSVILQRNKGDIYNLEYFITSLFSTLDENEINQVYKIISDELKYTDQNIDICTILNMCPGELWSKVDKAVKLRIENIVYESVKSGKYNSNNNECLSGALGTWINHSLLLNFENLDKWTRIIVEKASSADEEEKLYIEKYLWSKMCQANYNNIGYSLKNYFKQGLKDNDKIIIKKLETEIEFDENHPWWKVFEEELKEHPEIHVFDF